MAIEHKPLPNLYWEHVTVEFQYYNKNLSKWDCQTITMGVYKTLEEAIKGGNEALGKLHFHFTVEERSRQMLKMYGLSGLANRLIRFQCKKTGVEVFVKITKLHCAGYLDEVIRSVKSCAGDD